MKQHRWVAVLVLVNILAVIVVIGLIIFNNMRTAAVDITVAPSEAVIELNGRKYDNLGSYDILPGEYRVKISMEGMQTKEFDLILASDGFAKIETYLVDENGSFDYYWTHQGDEVLLAEVANDKDSKAFVEKYNKVTGIVNLLPLEYYDREDPNNPVGIFIDQDEDICQDDAICLSVYGGEKHKELALSLISEVGYNPDDYNVVFVSEAENVAE